VQSHTSPETEQWDRRFRQASLAISLIVAIAALLLVVVLLARQPETAPIEIRPPAPTATPVPTNTPTPWRVYVTGAVLHPGVVQLGVNTRVEDAVQAAGGCSSEADLKRVNLAAPLFDGQHLRVPAIGEELPASAIDDKPGAPSERIDINTATAEELDTLPGVGEVTAARIVEYRQQHGPFRTVEAIMDVPGIGEAKFDGMRELITVGP
jgi:competence protein ComEA